MKKIKYLAPSVLLLIFVTIITLFFIEIVLRQTKYVILLNTYKNKSLHSLNMYESDKFMGHDLSKNFNNAKGHPNNINEIGNSLWKVFTNNYGCYDKNNKISDSNYILLLGDSQTQGIEKYEHTWGYYLEQKLKYKVLKCGVVGSSPLHSKQKLIKLINNISYPPKLIIYGYHINDFDDDLTFPSLTVIENRLVRQNELNLVNGSKIKKNLNETKNIIKFRQNFCNNYHFIERYSCLYFTKTLTGILVYQKLKSKNLDKFLNLQKLRNIEEKIINYEMGINEEKIIKEKNKILIDQKKITPGNLGYYDFKKLDWLRPKFSDHLENILFLKNKAEEYSAKFLLLYIPEKIEIYPFLRNNQVGYSHFTKENIPRLNKRIFDFCHNSKIICLDPTQNLKTNAVAEFKDYYLNEQLYWHYDGHLRSHGNKILADILFNYIKKNINLD